MHLCTLTVPLFRVDCRIPEELWAELRTSPDSFWDNRTTKVNPRAPDFVHKASGDALWASSDPPAWYLEENALVSHTGPQLEPTTVGDPMDQTQTGPDVDGDATAEIAAAGATPGAWGDVAVPAPAGAAGADRWGGSGGSYFGSGAGGGSFPAAGGGAAAPRSRAAAPSGQGSASGDMAALWREFADSPQSFWDNREGKRNPRAPDFKHKETGKGLWVESAPEWFDPSSVPAKGAGGGGAAPRFRAAQLPAPSRDVCYAACRVTPLRMAAVYDECVRPHPGPARHSPAPRFPPQTLSTSLRTHSRIHAASRGIAALHRTALR